VFRNGKNSGIDVRDKGADLRKLHSDIDEHEQKLIEIQKSYDKYEEYFSVQLIEGMFIDEGTVAILQ
jgi:flagellar biosynthesis chaperone FliJ